MWSLKPFRSSKPRPPHATARRWDLEALEGRALLSGGGALRRPHGAPLQAEVAHPAKAQRQVPFRGRLEGVVRITSLGPTSASADLEATGNAAHLGRFTVSGTGVLDFAANIGVTTYTFTAANGDTLTAIATGSAEPTESPVVVKVTEEAIITGGTGRFADAEGSFTMVRHFNFATGETNGTIAGTISRPGARHR